MLSLQSHRRALMNLVIAIALMLGFEQPAAAQPEATEDEEQPHTLLSGDLTHGAYGGPVVSYTRFSGCDCVLVGGRGGWIVNHQLVLGGGGFGLVTRVHPPEGATSNSADYHLNFGYGGIWIEYLIAPMQIVHASVGTLIGAGGLSYTRYRPKDADSDTHSDSVFVLDPVVAVEVNVVRFMHVALQAGYRITAGVGLKSLRNVDVSGFTFGAIAKFGSF